jgi:ABC-type amino acid transport substrate-binding protein
MRSALFGLVSAVVLASSPVLCQEALRVASTPAGQPAPGLDANGNWEGIAIELLTELAKPRKVEFVQMNFSDLQGALTSSKVDVIAASFGITPGTRQGCGFLGAVWKLS